MVLPPPDRLCEYLEWDSSFFGLRVGRLTVPRLDTDTLAQAVQWCQEQHIDCLYFLADPGDPVTTRLAEDHRFRLVDVRVTLEAQLGEMPSQANFPQAGSVRLSRAEDLAALRSLARLSHRDSRFYYDGHFPEVRCHALYEEWIARSCAGWAEAVFVADTGEGPVGYCTCHLSGSARGRIGLVAVDPRAQGGGLGSQLVRTSLIWYRRKGAGCVSVVTQGRNGGAQRLYQRCGFLTRSVELWYHYWPKMIQAGADR